MSSWEAQNRKCLFFEIWLKSKIDGTRQPLSRRTAKRQALWTQPRPNSRLNYSTITWTSIVDQHRRHDGTRPQPPQKSIEPGTWTTKGQGEFRAFSPRCKQKYSNVQWCRSGGATLCVLASFSTSPSLHLPSFLKLKWDRAVFKMEITD